MLRPDRALALAEQTRVKVTIEPLTEDLDPAQAWEALKTWIREKPMHGPGRHLTRDELHERR